MSGLSRSTKAVILVALVALLGLVPISAANAAVSITLSRGSVIGGESINVGGTIGEKKVRKVVLQRQSGKTWVTVVRSQTTSKGAYKFGYKPPTKAGSRTVLRVLAPKTKIKGKKYGKLVSGGRSVLTVGQKATVTAPSVVNQDASFTISGKFEPARIGRAVVVQKPNGSSWVAVTPQRFQTSAGVVNFPMTLKTPGTFTFRVTALASDGAPAVSSAPVEVTVSLPVPTNLQATPGNASAALSWNAVTTPGLTGYNVYSSTDPNASPAAWTKLTSNPISATSYNATALTNGVTYYFAVTSVKAGDESAFSTKASAKPVEPADTTPPAVPTGVTAEAGTASAQVSWSAVAASDLKGYKVYRGTSAADPNPTLLTPSAITATSFAASGLNNGTTYYFFVTSVDNAGNESGKSTPASATPQPGADTTPPPVPGGVQASAGSGTAQVSWSAVSAADLAGYKVYRGASAGDANPVLLTPNPVTELTLPVSGLSNGTTYYFFVTSIDTSGNESAKSTPASAKPAAPPAGWAAVSAGEVHTCAIGTDKSLYCWGQNRYGQLGNPTGVETGNAYATPTRVGSATWMSVSVGDGFTCGIQEPGTLWCWGRDTYGQIGVAPNADLQAPHPTPTQVGAASTWTSVAAGGESACGIVAGNASCWGLNYAGQLGSAANSGSLTPNPTPTTVAGVTSPTSVTVGADHACAVQSGGTLKCWGSNTLGQLGNATNAGSGDPNAIPLQVAGTTWASVSAGEFHTCATTTTNTLSCWGQNGWGELGKAASESPFDENPTPSAVSGTTWKQVSAGGDHTCATTTDNTVFCWGRNQSGQLGKAANTTANATPAKVGAGTWATVDGGGQSTCARNNANQVFCWGLNEFGQLGNSGVIGQGAPTAGTTTPNPTPLVVPVPS
ncbi:alpha-tubulin suppressor-like RCC1 family protein/fibronectin type 3 domain-containing protein [Marmoricola sp. OAE513]|uniref:fibronectin type III domain-containing protein n=1 Tax=Marmoricola sp. OAE513 TaxID=2817894 RepID=UPI001AE8AA20